MQVFVIITGTSSSSSPSASFSPWATGLNIPHEGRENRLALELKDDGSEAVIRLFFYHTKAKY
jgi:hypothetical protein